MKAIVQKEYGPPHEILRLEDVDPPEVADDEVRVRVGAAATNAADWHLITGEPRISRLQMGPRRPRTTRPGCDLAGEVEVVGRNVTAFSPGDAVFGSTFMRGFGAFAEHAAVAADLLAPVPNGLALDRAAAVPLAGMTALQGLRDHARAEPGHTVLVVGASGGVGTFAVQIAKALGAEVTGVCSTRNVDLVRRLGADHVIDYTAENWAAGDRRYDVVLQAGGAASLSTCRRALRTKGTLLQVSGDGGGRWFGPLPRIVGGVLTSPFVGQQLRSFNVKASGDDMRALADLVAAGDVTPAIDRTYPLADTADAVAYQQAGHTQGKVVITV